MRVCLLLGLMLAFAMLSGAVAAYGVAPIVPNVVIDENGNGFWDGGSLQWTIGQDPAPGGQPNTLQYFLPFSMVTVGDVLMMDQMDQIVQMDQLVQMNVLMQHYLNFLYK